MRAFVYSTYVGIICDPLIELIINWPPQYKSTMVKTASAINVPFGRWHSYDTAAFATTLVRPLRQGFVMRALD